MADIFISYLREDIEAAEKLAEALEAHGWSVFWDRRIPAGKRFDDFLDEQLQTARCVIVLWSLGSIHSDWVKDEAAVGRDRGILVPARLDDVLAPFGFRTIQAAHLIDWQGDPSHWGFQQLLRDIRAVMEVPARVVLAGVGEPFPRVSQKEEAGANRRADEERQRRGREETETKRRAEEERQRRQQEEAEAKRQAVGEEHQAEVKQSKEEAQVEAEATKEQQCTPPPAHDADKAAEGEKEGKHKETFNSAPHNLPAMKSGSSKKRWFIAFGTLLLFVISVIGFLYNNEPTNNLVQEHPESLSASDQYKLGVKYQKGTGVPQDYTVAAKWFRKAADQGHTSAQYKLGLMYEKGQGVPKDDAEAVKWYRKAAEQGNAGAQDKLGAMYADGRGVPKDDAEAVRWHRMAAEQRDEDAQAIQNMFKMLEKFRAAP